MTFSSDEKELRLAEGKDRDLLALAERWIVAAPHRKGCASNQYDTHNAGKYTKDESKCSCGKTTLVLAFMDARRAGRLP